MYMQSDPAATRGGRPPPRPQGTLPPSYEVPRDANPQTRSPAPRPVDRRPQEVATPQPEDFNSHPPKGPRALPRECTPQVTPCEGAYQGWYGGTAPPQVGKTQEAEFWRPTPTFYTEFEFKHRIVQNPIKNIKNIDFQFFIIFHKIRKFRKIQKIPGAGGSRGSALNTC